MVIKARVVTPFEARGEDELTVAVNDIVIVVKHECEPGWSSAQLEGKKHVGLIPTSYFEIIEQSAALQRTTSQLVTILYDYVGQDSADLSVTAGQKVEFVRLAGPDADGYSICRDTVTQKQGFVPTAYHSKVEEVKQKPSLPQKSFRTQTEAVKTSTPSSPTPQPSKPLPMKPPKPSAITTGTGSPPTPSKLSTPSTPTPKSPAKPVNTPSTTTNPSSPQPQSSQASESPAAKRQKRRREMVKELIKTEESYVTNLTIFWQVYAMRARPLLDEHSSFTDNDFHLIFGNLEQITGTNKMLLQSLKQQAESVGAGNEDKCCVGQIFRELAPFFKMYTDFINNYDPAIETYERLLRHKYFKQYLLDCEQDPLTATATSAFGLDSLLINPIQRIPRYQLLLQGISEVTEKDHEDYEAVQTALTQICEIAQYCNQSKAVSDALGNYYRISGLLAKQLKFEGFIQSHRRLIVELQVSVSMKSVATRASVIPTAKQNLSVATFSSRLRDSILPSPRQRISSQSQATDGEIFTAYVFTDALVLEKDTTVSESRTKHIELFFLQFCTLVISAENIMIDTVSDNAKRSIVLRPKESNDDYDQSYEQFKNSLQEAVNDVQSLFMQKLKPDTSFIQCAYDRMQIESKRKVAQTNLHDNLMLSLDSRKRLHTIEEDIIKKEDELKRVQEELAQLREDRKNFLMMTKMTESKVKDFDVQLEVQLDQLSKVDSVLIASLNEQTESFNKVFSDEPCVVRKAEANQPNDIYHGHKLRRRGSLNPETQVNYDYSAFEQSPLREILARNYNEHSVLFSSMVYCVNAKGAVRERRLIVTEASLTIFKISGSSVKYHIPIRSITCLSTSTYDDNFFCIHSAELNDSLYSSIKKTEIMQILIQQAKKLYDRELVVIAATSFLFSPIGSSGLKKLRMEPRTLEQDDFQIVTVPTSDIWRVKYDPKRDDAAFRQNKIFKQKESQITDSGLLDTTPSLKTDLYSGMKMRRRASISRICYGDYLSMFRGSEIKKLSIDPALIGFCDEVQKINERLKTQNRVLIVTNSTLYYIDPQFKAIKGSVALTEIESIDVSTLNDNFFLVHVKGNKDLLLCSEKKTEILTIIRKFQSSITIHPANSFNFRRKDKCLTGTFIEDASVADTVFQVLSSSTFSVTASRLMKSPLIIESMEVQIDGLPQPVILLPDSTCHPIVKLPRSSTFITCNISYYALDMVRGFHIEQTISQKTLTSLTPVVHSTSIDDSPKSEKKYVVTLKKQKIGASKIAKTPVKIRILDAVGQEVGLFKFQAQL